MVERNLIQNGTEPLVLCRLVLRLGRSSEVSLQVTLDLHSNARVAWNIIERGAEAGVTLLFPYSDFVAFMPLARRCKYCKEAWHSSRTIPSLVISSQELW